MNISLQSSLTLLKWAIRRCRDLVRQTSLEAGELANLYVINVHYIACKDEWSTCYDFGQRRIIKTKA